MSQVSDQSIVTSLTNIPDFPQPRQAERGFTKFTELPGELRLKIWKHTLKPRYIRLLISHTPEATEGEREGIGYRISHAYICSILESASFLPAALRVHHESRDWMLPLYPNMFQTKFEAKKREHERNHEIEYRKLATSSQEAESTFTKKPWWDDINSKSIVVGQRVGARVNVQLDTVVFVNEYLLDIFRKFAELEEKAKIRHLAVPRIHWTSLATNIFDRLQSILLEYEDLQTISIFDLDYECSLPDGKRKKLLDEVRKTGLMDLKIKPPSVGCWCPHGAFSNGRCRNVTLTL